MRSAVVVGAGVGGLATAGALDRTGWRVTLVERADRVPADATAAVLWGGGVRAARQIGLGAALDAMATPVPSVSARDPSGRVLCPPPDWGAAAPVVVPAGELLDALVANLGERVELRTGFDARRLLVEPGRRPAVGDGRATVEADLVVAADGAASAIRARLLPGSAARPAGCAAWQAVIPWYRVPGTARPSAPVDGAGLRTGPAGGAAMVAGHGPVTGAAASGSAVDVLGVGYRFQSLPLADRGGAGRAGVAWVATAPGAARPEPPANQLALLRRWFAGWPQPVPTLLAATEPDDLVQREVRELHPPPDRYAFPTGAGGLALVGDAGHALAHHLGLGVGLALEDAAVLAALAARAEPGPALAAALAGYERQRRPRIADAVRRTRRLGALLGGRRSVLGGAIRGGAYRRLLADTAAAAAAWRPSP